MPKTENMYIVWNPFQRRAETLAAEFDLDIRYIHFSWEERGRAFKVISYIPKFLQTIWLLISRRPDVLFVQLAPTPLLYAAALYKLIFGVKLVADCHNTMIYDDHWIKWPFAKALLRRADIVLVHNDDVKKLAQDLDIYALVLRDPLPLMQVPSGVKTVGAIDLDLDAYVIIPCGIAADEPVEELFSAIEASRELLFVMTWFSEKLPPELRGSAPQNLRFTGFLPEPDFNALYSHAQAALVLTTREGTQPSGAAEAIALGVPLIVSDLSTTRRLYKQAALFVKNEAGSIAEGIQDVMRNRSQQAEAVSGLRTVIVHDSLSQIERVKTLLSGGNERC